VRGDRDGVRGVHLRHLVDDDHVAEQVEPGTADLFRPRNAEQPQLSHPLDGRPGKFSFRVALGSDGRNFIAREFAHHVADGDVLLGKVERVFHSIDRLSLQYRYGEPPLVRG